MAEITVDVGVRLKAMQSSVADLQKVLDGLQPNSSGFKALQRIIADINRDMDRLRIQTSKPFGSQNQFSQTEKTVEKLEDSLEKVKITIDRIKFSDLKLDSSQTAQLDNFKQQLKDIKKEFTDFKADLKGQFLDNDFNKAFVEGINPNLLNKNFDEIVKNVESRVNSLGSTLAKAKADLENFQNAAKIGEKINKASQTANGVVSPEVMGKEMFDKFFQTNSKGVFSFKTGGGLKKGEIQQQFLEYLTSEFQLSQTQIDQLKNQTAGNIRKILAQDDFFNPQKGAAETATKKMSGAESAFTTASKNYENAAAVVARLTPLLSALTNEETSLEDKQKLVNQAIKQFEQDCVNGAKGSKTLQDSTKGLSSGLESFKQQLGQVNAQWLNLQKQQATFNSMKSAIVNFMGFNQVLNITKRAVKEAMDHIKQLDTVMNGIAIVTDMTTADLWNQVDVYSEMAQRYGTSIQGAYEVSKIYYQAGYETNEVLTLMNETLKLSKISGLDYATTTDYMMTATRGFHMEVSEASKVVDVYSALAANTAVSQQELAEAMTKTASSMESVGTTFQEASAMIATMVATTRESANNIGSAMKSIASRYGELTKDPVKLMDAEGEAMSFNKVDAALKSVGISLQTTDHQFRSFTDVILELSEKWDTLDSVQQRYIATQFAGNRQQSRFLALVSNPEQIKENLEVAQNSEDTGTLQALKALDSLESKLSQVQVAYQQFYTTIGAESAWKMALDGIKNFIDSLNGLPKVFDKIPIGAIAVLGNLIGLVKTALLNGLTTIAQEWNNIMNSTNNNAAGMAQNGGDKIGKTWIGALFSAIKEGQPKIEAAMEEAVGSGNQKAGQDIKYTGTKINTEDFLFKDYYSKNFDPNDTKVAADTYLQTLVNMEQAGTQFSQSTLNQLLDVGAAVENGSISLREAGQRAVQIIQDTGSAAETNTSRISNFWQELGKSGSNWQKGLTGLSQSLTTIGMLLDKTSESGRIMSGVMTGLGGAVQTGVAAARVMAQDWSALPQLIMGIFNVINGVGIAWETDAERLERLTKEAENLTNESKKAKAEYNTLQRSIDKLDELEKKRYDSAEAAEEYQTAVDELANQFPQLVTSLDEMGNATIETANLEYELENARKAAAEATLKAAQAEREKAESELKNAQGKLLDTRNSISNSEGEVSSNFFIPDYSEVGKRKLTDITIQDWFGETSVLGMLGIDPNKQYNQQEILQQLASSGNFGINRDEYGNFELPDENSITAVLENMYSVASGDAMLFYKQISSLTDETHKINTEQVEEFSKAIQELEPESDNFNDTVAKLAHDIAEAKLQEIFPDFMNYASDLANGLEEVNQFSEILDSTERVELSAAINNFGKEQQEFVKNLGEGNGILTQFLYSQADAYQKAKKGDLKSYIDTELKNDYQEFETAYNALDPKVQERFLEMWKNRSQYTAKDFQISLNLKDKDPVLEGIQEYYQEQIPNYWKLLQDKVNTDLGGMGSNLSGVRLLTNQVIHGKDIISKDLMSWYSSIIDVVSDYAKQGKTTSANTIATQSANIFGELKSITDPANRASIIGVMNEYGLTTVSGITSIIENLEDISGTESIITHLNSLKDALTYNIPLAIQAYTDKIVSDAEDLEKNIKNISNGMSMTEAVAALEKINSTEGVTATLADFTEKNGQFYLKDAEMRERYFQAVINGETAELNALQGEVDKFADSAKEKQLQLIRASKGKTFNKDEYQDVYDTLSQLGLIEDVIDNETKEVKGFKVVADKWDEFVEGKDSISEAIYLYLTGQLSTAQEIADYISKTLPARAALEAGKYQEYLETLFEEEADSFDLTTIASGEFKTDDKQVYDKIKPVKEKLNSVYSSLISDAFSKGLDNLDARDYEGLIDDSFDAGEEGPHRYEEFVKRYANLAGKSIEEINALIIQAIEKDTQTTTGAAAEAIGKIQWLSSEGKGFAALKDIQTLADALGISVDKILGEYNNQLDMYLVDLSNVEGIDLNEIDGFSDTVKDSINAFLKQIFENVNKAITGKLSNADVTTLTGQLEQLGLKNLTLDFTETVDGLKLSQRSAIELYNELKKIDALQAQLVFDELAKSLESSNENYSNISTVLKRIADLQDEISKMEPGDARLKMYQDELAVAQEIARTRSSTDNKDFDFMNRSLPNGMQNPISYWDSIGEAYKAMNTAAKSGYMEIQDFYNIVQEMNNMAAVSGQSLEFMGQTLSGKAEDAAALIQRGFSALSNVKGDGVKVALNNIGSDFTTGANAMKGDFDTGIRAMADAQIAMLDAAINMLEAIVAMEDIDIDKDGFLDLGEIFANGKDLDGGFTKEVEAWLQKLEVLTGGIEIDGKSFREALMSLEPDEIQKVLNELYSIDWTLGDVDVFSQIQKVLKAFYPNANITSSGKSIFDILQVPKDAEKNSDKYNEWLEKAGIAAEEADNLIRYLEKGVNISVNGSTGQTIEKLLGLTKENKATFEKFIEDGYISQDEIRLFSELNIDYNDDGSLKSAKYTASDGTTLNLTEFDPSTWQDEIAKYENQILIGSHTGEKAENIDVDKNKLTEITLSDGTKVNGVISGEAGVFTASYKGQSKTFDGPTAYADAQNWIKEQAEQDLYKVGETGGAITKRNEITGELEVVPAFKVVGKKTEETDAAVAEFLQRQGEDLQKYIEEHTENGKIVLPNIPVEFEEGTDGSVIQQYVDQLYGDGSFDTLPGKIAEGIKTAFTEDTSIGEAIGKGIAEGIATADFSDKDLTVPEAKAVLDKLTITEVNEVGFGNKGGIAGSAAGVVSEIFGTNNLTIPEATASIGILNINKVDSTTSDSQGLASLFSSDTLISKDVTVTLNNGETIDLSVTGLDTSSDTWTLNGISTSGQEISFTGTQIAGLTLSEKTATWSLSSFSPNTSGVDLGAATITNLSYKKGVWTLTDSANGSITITADEFNGLLNNELALIKDATGNLVITPNTPDIDITTKAATASFTSWLRSQDGRKISVNIVPKGGGGGSSGGGAGRNTTKEQADLIDTSFISSKVAKVASSFKNIIPKLKIEVDKKESEATAKEAVSGIVDTLSGSASAAQFAGETFANAIPGGMRKVLEIQSPSKVTEEIGEQVVAGLVEGMSDTSSAEDSAITLAQKVVNSIQEYLNVNPLEFTVNANVNPGSTPTPTNNNNSNPTKTPSIFQNIVDTIKQIKSNPLQEIKTASEKINTDKIEDIESSSSKISTEEISTIQSVSSQINSTKISDVKSATNTINATGAQRAKEAINGIPSNKNINLTATITVKANGQTKVTGDGIALNDSKRRIQIAKSGNVALSAGRQTLMGELGPELVVSNGHYFVVGQDGPEMVDLAEDAIVFNHLQTASLLNKGKTKGHGRPVTNERKATSMATGNLEGPAMASAEQALETLRQLRAMWESLRGASLRDLGSLVGSGGAGGGSGSSSDSADVGSVVKQVERWYNWLQKIEQSQQKINKLTKEYNLLEKQHASSSELAVNLQERYNELVEQRATRQQLAQEQTAARQEMQERLNNSAFSAFYHANDDGSITLTDDAAFQRFTRGRRVKGKVWTQKALTKAEARQRNKENDKWNEAHQSEIEAGTVKKKKTDYQAGDMVKDKKKTFKKPKSGLELMAELQRTDAAGNNIYSAKEQFKILKDLGFEDFMRDQADGTRIEGSDAESLKQAVENFYERIETDKAEFESLTQSIQEQEDAALDDSLALLEINEQLEELANVPAGIVEGLEKWHDLTRAIARQQEKINILNQQFSRLQNDNKINGEKIFENLQKQRAELKKQLKLNKQLLKERRAAYDERINNLTDLQQDFFTVNEEGQLNYRQNKRKKKKVKITDRQILRDSEGNPITDEQGMVQYRESRRSVNIATSGQQLIDELTRQNEDGTAAYTAEQQFEILRQLGYAQAMMYDSEGNRLFSSADTATRDEQESAVREFLEEIQGFSTTMDEEIDAIHELDGAIEDSTTALQQVEQQIRENEMNVENQVLEALKNQRQQEIDESKKNRDAIKEATDRFVDGLQEQLDKEKQLYEQQENQQELDEMRRRLALLQRSGGSASEIRDLQKRISEQEKDMYFEQRQEQIDAIKEASEAELEKLDRQIEIQENLLDFQIANGLLWDEVREIMAGGFDNIFSFITEFSSEFQSASVLGQESLAEQIGDAIAEYVAGTPEALQEAVQNGLNDYQNTKGKKQKNTLTNTLNMSREEAAQVSTDAKSAYREAFTRARNQGQSIEEASEVASAAANKVYAEAMWNQVYNANLSNLVNNLGLNDNQAKALKKSAKNSFIESYLQKIKTDKPSKALKEATTAAKKVIAEKALSLTSIVSATGSEAHREEIERENTRINLIDSRLAELKRKKSTQGLTSAESSELAHLTEERRTRQARINQLRNDSAYSSLTVEALTAQGYSADRVEQARQEWLNQYMDSATGEVDQEGITAIATRNKSFDATLKKGKWPLYDATTLKKTNKTIGNENNTTDLKITGYKEKDGSYYLLTNKSTKYLALSDFKNQSTIKGYIDNKRLKKYKQGGLIDYTGLAWVDGSKTKPESILSAEQTELLRHSLLDNQYSMASLVATAQESLHNLANSNIYNSIDENSGVTIEKLEFTMNVPSIANDYDARRAGQQAFNEMVNIARKTGNRIISRR